MYLKYFNTPYLNLIDEPINGIIITKHTKYIEHPCYVLISSLQNKEKLIQELFQKLELIKGIISTKEIIEELSNSLKDLTIFIECENPTLAWAHLCKLNFPQTPEHIIGITGTSGKTSTTSFTHQLLRSMNQNVLLINTLGIFYNDEKIANTNNTTPDAFVLHKHLNEFTKQFGNNSFAILEISSIGVEQNRVKFIDFEVGLWNNFSPEHLDYHENMGNYFKAKNKFTTHCKNAFVHNSVIDPVTNFVHKNANYGSELINVTQNQTLEISLQMNVESSIYSKIFELSFEIFGIFQAENVLSAITSLKPFFSIEEIMSICKKIQLKTPVGRMEKVGNCIIDNSHKPEALKSALQSIAKIKPNRIIVVCGCGGNRDKIKRPIMGEIMQNFADIAIITSDNPRFENPIDIINDITSSMTNFIIIENREDAIKYAISIMNDKDICLIAGKGSETSQEINGQSFPFSDKAIVQKYLQQK